MVAGSAVSNEATRTTDGTTHVALYPIGVEANCLKVNGMRIALKPSMRILHAIVL